MKIDKAIKIRKKFLRLLKENNLLNAYIKNFNKACETGNYQVYEGDIKNIWNLLNINKKDSDLLVKYLSRYSRDLFIDYSFLWEDTPEGHRLWKSLNEIWKYDLYNYDDDIVESSYYLVHE